MKPTTIQGLIRRRVLVNYRVDPDVIRPLVPASFELATVGGFAMAGICLIRLESVRPGGVTPRVGLGSENVAYRVAIRAMVDGSPTDAVYIPRRDTSSSLQARLGGRIFPGQYRHAEFDCRDEAGRLAIACRSADGRGDVDLLAREEPTFPAESVFESLEAASAFFERGAIGYSRVTGQPRLDGLLLRPAAWTVSPLAVESVRSSFFDDPATFPAGAAMFDNALIMRDIAHEWRSLPSVAAA